MKLQFPINLKNTEFLQTTPTLRSTWTFKLSSIALGVATAISLLSIAIHWNRLPPLLPLWYSKPWGIERLVPPYMLLAPLVASLLIYAGNIVMATRFASTHLMFARVLFLTSALVSVMSAIIILRIISLVT